MFRQVWTFESSNKNRFNRINIIDSYSFHSFLTISSFHSPTSILFSISIPLSLPLLISVFHFWFPFPLSIYIFIYHYYFPFPFPFNFPFPLQIPCLFPFFIFPPSFSFPFPFLVPIHIYPFCLTFLLTITVFPSPSPFSSSLFHSLFHSFLIPFHLFTSPFPFCFFPFSVLFALPFPVPLPPPSFFSSHLSPPLLPLYHLYCKVYTQYFCINSWFISAKHSPLHGLLLNSQLLRACVRSILEIWLCATGPRNRAGAKDRELTRTGLWFFVVGGKVLIYDISVTPQ